jgi:hypothetical protein
MKRVCLVLGILLCLGAFFGCQPTTSSTTYTVTYDANGGSGTVPIDTNRYLPGATVTVLPTLSESWGWCMDSDGSTTHYAPAYMMGSIKGARVITYSTFTMPSENVILYAIWPPA